MTEDKKFDSLSDDLRSYLPKHMEDVGYVSGVLLAIHVMKESGYKLSFARRGEYGIFHNLARKWDRIENAYHGTSFDSIEVLDAIADMAVYAIKWMAVIMVLHPETFKKWMEHIDMKKEVPEQLSFMDDTNILL
jgi:hypothetical protein